MRRRFQRQDDAIHHGFDIAPDFPGPKSQHAKACAFEDAITNRVVLRLNVASVLESVDFDHQPPREADEVEIVAQDRRLPADMESALAQAL